MAEKNKKKKLKIIFRRDKEKKKDALKELKIAYRRLLIEVLKTLKNIKKEFYFL